VCRMNRHKVHIYIGCRECKDEKNPSQPLRRNYYFALQLIHLATAILKLTKKLPFCSSEQIDLLHKLLICTLTTDLSLTQQEGDGGMESPTRLPSTSPPEHAWSEMAPSPAFSASTLPVRE
jgi:hypothetical protein